MPEKLVKSLKRLDNLPLKRKRGKAFHNVKWLLTPPMTLVTMCCKKETEYIYFQLFCVLLTFALDKHFYIGYNNTYREKTMSTRDRGFPQ